MERQEREKEKLMLNAQFRPLDQWPGERRKLRVGSSFRSSYTQTLDLLKIELSKLNAKNVVIQIDELKLSDIRNDGTLKGPFNTVRLHGVIVSFESNKGAVSFPCDRYYHWKDNLRAIALALEALRAVDRYGVTRGNEQYRGWAKLEAPGAKNGKMDRQTAGDFLSALCGLPRTVILAWDPDKIRDICRTARFNNHPDRGGGSHETFVTIAEAERVLTS
jgi:hypothetical protein